MISSLRGVVLAAARSRIVLDVGGVGYSITVTAGHAAGAVTGAETTILTTMIVHQEAVTLLGFESDADLEMFQLLTSVNGVGPRLALAALGTLPAADMALAIEQDNDASLRAVPGVGVRTARLIVVSLRGRVRGLLPAGIDVDDVPAAETPVDVPARGETIKALISLGWNERKAVQAIEDALALHPGHAAELTVPALLRLALVHLGRPAR